MIAAIGPGDPPLDELRRARCGSATASCPAPNLTCGRCRFCLDERFPYYLCRELHDYGNSLTCAEPPHLFGGWSELMYLLPGTRLFRVPEGLPAELAALTELMAVTHGLDAGADAARARAAASSSATRSSCSGPARSGLVHLARPSCSAPGG